MEDKKPRKSHDKMDPSQLKSHAYAKDDLDSMLNLASTGLFKYSDLCNQKKIPKSTFSNWVRGKTKTTDRGPHKTFSKEHETRLAEYVNDRFEMGIPISIPTFKKHLLAYLRKKKLPNPFKDGKIGRGWLRRFIRDFNPKFVSKGQERKEYKKPLDFAHWIKTRNDYILPRNEGDFFLLRDQIIVLDSDEICSMFDSSLKFQTMNVYTAAGSNIKSFLIHDGCIPNDFLNKYSGHVSFIKSTSGMLTPTCIKIAVNHVERFMVSNDIPFPSIIYLTPKVWEKLDLFSWNFASKKMFILCPIPTFIHMVVSFSNMTAYNRIKKIMNTAMAKRFGNFSKSEKLDIMLEAYNNAVTHPTLETRFRSHCRRCRIVTTKKLKLTNLQITQETEVPDPTDVSLEIEDSQESDS